MEISQEEFEKRWKEFHDVLLKALAEDPEISMDKFYSMACFMENLTFFGPVLYDLVKNSKKKKDDDPGDHLL